MAKIKPPSLYLQDPGTAPIPWERWFGRFECFLRQLQAPPGREYADGEKNDLLLSHLGEEGYRLLHSDRSKPPDKTYLCSDPVSATWDEFRGVCYKIFKKKLNPLRAGLEITNRQKSSSETYAEYLADLRTLAAQAQLGEFEDRILCQQLVWGGTDEDLQQKIFQLPDEDQLQLDKVLNFLQSHESALLNSRKNVTVHASRAEKTKQGAYKRFQTPGRGQKNQQKNEQLKSTNKNRKCFTCGGNFNPKHQCPARDTTCTFCHRKGHWEKVCWKKVGRPSSLKQNEIQSTDDEFSDEEAVFCNSARNDCGKQELPKFQAELSIMSDTGPLPWSVDVDSQSDVTTMPLKTYDDHFKGFRLNKPTQKILSYTKNEIQNYGTFKALATFKNRRATLLFHVIPDRYKPILGKMAIQDLKLWGDPDIFKPRIQPQIKSMSEISKKNSADELKKKIEKDYPNLVASEMPEFPDYQHRITINDETKPFASKLQSVPLAHREKANDAVKEMLDLGIWEPCPHSDWAHKPVFIGKPSGDLRVTTNLIPLNRYVIPDRFPLPNINDLFLELSGAKIFTKLDCAKAYFSIPLHPESRPLTATLTAQGLFQYKRLPMGLKDSGAVFQRCISKTLQGIPNCQAYVDDILVYGKDKVEHDEVLSKVLIALNEKNFRLNVDKCIYRKSSVPFLGHIISDDGISPNPKRVQVIRDFPKPQDVQQVQRFMGLCNYCRAFIPNLATIAEPIQKLTRVSEPFVWAKEQEKAFERVKNLFADSILKNAIFDVNSETILTTDASNVGLGAVLSQIQNRKEVIIAFAHHVLAAHERNYATNELEALAIVFGCETFSKFLLGRHFTVQTDHGNLSSLLQNPANTKKSAKFQRWWDRLSEFDFTIKKIPGRENAAADAISRCSESSSASKLVSSVLSHATTLKKLSKHSDLSKAVSDVTRTLAIEHAESEGISMAKIQATSKQDTVISKVQRFCKSEWPSKEKIDISLLPYYHRRNEIVADNGFLTLQHERIVLPQELIPLALNLAHLGHPGISRMKEKLRSAYWWPRFNATIETFVKHCECCQFSEKSISRLPPPEKAQKLPMSNHPWDLISMDILGPFDKAPSHQKYIVVLIDHYSSFPEILLTGDITSEKIIKWMEEICSRYGYPSRLLTDNGPQFVSQKMNEYLSSKDIDHLKSPVYNPQSNGKVERFNKYLLHGIQATGFDHFQKSLLDLLRSYRLTSPHGGVKSPAQLFSSRSTFRDSFVPVRHSTRKVNDPPKSEPKSDIPSNLLLRGPFKKNDSVLRYQMQVPKGVTPWKGPFKIIKVLGNYTYKLSDGSVWHARKLKRYIPQSVHWSDDTLQFPNQNRASEEPRRSTRTRKPPQRYKP